MESVVRRLSNMVSGPMIANSAVGCGGASNIFRLQDFQPSSNSSVRRVVHDI